MNYYQVLGLSPEATEKEIKSAYRTLAKVWHPDKNKAENARAQFIVITEAYQILSDENLRPIYDQKLHRSSYREQSMRQKEQEYRAWFERYQQQAQRNAQAYASSSYDEFEQSPIFKTAMVLSRIYNYLFFGIGVCMVFGPLTLWYIREAGMPNARPWYNFIFPSLIGLAFTYGIYYFLFKYKVHETE
jgi:curved DNA-binding protein CbpA